jgi:hypothetical protein
MRKLLTVLLLALVMLAPGCFTLLPIIVTFEVNPYVITAGGSSSLNWNVTGASTINISPAPGTVGPAGTATVNPITTTAYTITAQGPFGAVSRSVVLTVNPAPIAINFNANPALLQSGGSATLQWNVSGADTISIDQGIGNVSPNGIQVISPTQTTTYTLSARNASGIVTRTATVTVNPPIVANFSASPTNIYMGQSATLTWNVSGADTVTIDPGIGTVAPSGSVSVNPSSTTSYTLKASTSCCVLTKAAVVTVGTVYPYNAFGYPYDYYNMYPYGTPYPFNPGYTGLTPFIEIFNASPSHVSSGMPALLSWSVVGATSITITGIGNVPPSGTRIVVPPVTTIYTLTASNAYTATTQAVTVQVP